jgi:plastocyanin
MNKKATIAIVIAVIVILGILGLVLMNGSDDTTTPTTTTPTTTNDTNTDTSSGTGTTTSSAATISYTDNGFNPDSLTVKSGTVVTVKNDSSQDLQFSSDPHPVHTENPELNEEVISSGQRSTFTVTKTGTFGYHNHLDENDTGTLVVQ